jgi:hypothetical protein
MLLLFFQEDGWTPRGWTIGLRLQLLLAAA